MHTIAIANQKGGCGKTTTAVSLSACLAARGYKVLLIDLDPQGHATLGLGIDANKLRLSIYDLLLKPDTPLHEVIKWTDVKNLWIAPANILLSGADLELINRMGREKVLEEALSRLDDFYDFVIIDCVPSLGILTVNALNYAKEVLIPIQAQYYALEGMKQLFLTIDQVKRRLNPELKILGVLLTMVDTRAAICNEVVEGIRDYFKDKVFKTVIQSSFELMEAPSAGQPITVYDPESQAAKEYQELAAEILNRKFHVALPDASLQQGNFPNDSEEKAVRAS